MEKNYFLAQLSKITTFTFIIILVSLFWAHPAKAADIIIQDGSMEGVGVAPWTTYGQVGLIEKSNVQSFDGVQSMHIVSNIINGRGGFRQQNLPVEAGKTYELSFRYFLIQGTLSNWLSIQNPNAAYDGRTETLRTLGEWTLFTRQFTVPENFAGAGFALMFNTQNANVYVDNVSITLAPEDAPVIESYTNNTDNLFVSPVTIVPPQRALSSTGETLPAVTINQGNVTTTSSEVELTFNVTGAVWVGINTTSSFQGVSFIPFTPTTTWKLSPELGEKQLFFEFRSPDSGVLTFNEKIQLVSPLPEVGGSEVIPPHTAEIPCSLNKEAAYKDAQTQLIYFVTSTCTKRYFVNNTYQTYPDLPTESSLKKTDQLATVKQDSIPFMPLGPGYTPVTGDLIKTPDNAHVYLVVGNQRYTIASAEVFTALGYDFKNVKDVDTQIVASLTDGGMLGQR